jgi:hypothetical protein
LAIKPARSSAATALSSTCNDRARSRTSPTVRLPSIMISTLRSAMGRLSLRSLSSRTPWSVFA